MNKTEATEDKGVSIQDVDTTYLMNEILRRCHLIEDNGHHIKKFNPTDKEYREFEANVLALNKYMGAAFSIMKKLGLLHELYSTPTVESLRTLENRHNAKYHAKLEEFSVAYKRLLTLNSLIEQGYTIMECLPDVVEHQEYISASNDEWVRRLEERDEANALIGTLEKERKGMKEFDIIRDHAYEPDATMQAAIETMEGLATLFNSLQGDNSDMSEDDIDNNNNKKII